MFKLFPAGLALALAAPLAAQADTATDINVLRREIETIRADYEARLKALEQRLQAAEAAGGAGSPASPITTTPMSAPAANATTAGANAFNPAMSLILSGLYTRTSQDPSRYAITGFQLPRGAEVGPGTRGFSLAESELGFAASIDPWLRGAANIALHGDDSVSVEEAFVQTTSLGNGLSLKAGRFFSGIGYLNPQHSHTWDFVDNPLAYQAMLGTQYGDDGVQLTWLAPIDQFIELGVELGRGRSFPGSDNSRNGAGMTALTAHTGGDIGDSHSWRAGLSVLSAKADDQALDGLAANGSAVTNAFSGSTRVWVADAVWKWAPERQRHAHQLQAAGRVPAQHAQRQPGLRPGQHRQRRAPIAQRSRAGTCKASTSSCRAGASACAPSGSTRARRTTAPTPACSRPATTGRARTR